MKVQVFHQPTFTKAKKQKKTSNSLKSIHGKIKFNYMTTPPILNV